MRWRRAAAHAELVELAELLGAPVYTEFVPSTASFPASHPLFRGSMIRLAPDVRKVLDQYDVLFSVGGDLFTLSLPSDVDPMPPGIKLIHLDIDPWELGKNYPPAVAILGDPKATLPEITAAVRERMTSGARGAARERLTSASRCDRRRARDARKPKPRALADATPVQPLALLHAIGEMLPKDAVVIEEALSSAPGIRQLIRSDDPQSYFGLRGGGIGWGLPATIGVKLALPDRPGGRPDRRRQRDVHRVRRCGPRRAIASTAVFVILNNSVLSHPQAAPAQHARARRAGRQLCRHGAQSIPRIDFVGLARSLGIKAERAKTVHEATDLVAAGDQGRRPAADRRRARSRVQADVTRIRAPTGAPAFDHLAKSIGAATPGFAHLQATAA